MNYGMNTVALVVEPKIADLRITEAEITAYLMDGRTVSVPLAWSWRLSEATSEQRNHWEIIGDGTGIHWPEIDEDISIEGMLYGATANAVVINKLLQQHDCFISDASCNFY